MDSGSNYVVLHRQQSLAAYGRTLAVWSLLLGAGGILGCLYATFRFYIGIPFEDQWATIEELGDHGGHYTLALLWALHNEHRMPFTKLMEMADLYWFRGHNISLYFEIYVLQFVLLLTFIYAIRRESLWPKWLVTVGAGLAALALFWLSQHQSFNPLGVGILPAFQFGVFSVIAFMVAIERPERPSPAWFALSLVCAFVSEASLANGLLVWPLLLVLGLRFRVRFPFVLTLAFVGAASIALYLVGFQSPSDHASPVDSLRKPLLVGQYLLIYFGYTWSSLNAEMGEALALFGLTSATLCYARELLRRNARLFPLCILSLCMFLFGTGVLTALGRINFGLVQATSSRYQSSALLFWLCLALYALDVAVRHRLRTALLTAAAILLLATSILPSFPNAWEGAAEVGNRVNSALAIYSDVKDDGELCCKIVVKPNLAFRERPFLMQHHTAFYADWRHEAMGQTLSRRFRIEPPNRCFGAFDVSRKVPDPKFPGWELTGWVWDHKAMRPVEGIVAVTENDVISGAGVTGIPRPDLASVYPEIVDPAAGWRAYIQGAKEFPAVRVYGVVDHGKGVCLATPPFAVPKREPPR